jgi:hypothetical protein
LSTLLFLSQLHKGERFFDSHRALRFHPEVKVDDKGTANDVTTWKYLEDPCEIYLEKELEVRKVLQATENTFEISRTVLLPRNLFV